MNYAFDPLTPYVVAYSTGDRPLGRFRRESDAERFRDVFLSEGVIVNTTPKPKIPEDAQHITWGSGVTAFSRRWDGWVGGSHDEAIAQDTILSWIGDAEVTVLVPREAGGGSRTEEDA